MTEKRTLRISPSQLSSWEKCPRDWAWPILGDAPREDKLGPALVGDRLHYHAENWLRDGTPPDLEDRIEYPNPRAPEGPPVVRYPGRIFEAGMHLNPAPGTPGMEIETTAHFGTKISEYKGRIDVRYPDPADGLIVVQDHKSCGSLDYALSPIPGTVNRWGENVYMGDNVQCLIYAADAMLAFDVDRVRLDWVYYETAPRSGGRHRAEKRSLVVLRDEIGRGMQKVETKAALIQEVYRSGLHPLDLPPNPSKCEKYGGCDHVARCNLTEQEKIEGLFMTQESIDPEVAAILAELRAGAGPSPAANVPAAPPPPPAPPAAPPPPPAPPPPLAGSIAGKSATMIVVDDTPNPDRIAVTFGDWGSALGATAGDTLPGEPSDAFLARLGAAKLSVRQEGPRWVVCPENAAQAFIRGQGKGAQAIAWAADGADPINPPEAPEDSVEPPEDAPPPREDPVTIPDGGLAAMDRAAMKKLAVQMGLVDSGCRFGEDRLRRVLGAALASATAVDVPAPPPPPPLPEDAIEGPGPVFEIAYSAARAHLPDPTSEPIALAIAHAFEAVERWASK